MTDNSRDGLTALEVLRGRLDGTSHLEVIHEGGYCWKAHFTFNNPASPERLEALKCQLTTPLPVSYERFLLHYDGAILYKDDEYGQWGFKLYGTQELFEENLRCRQIYREDWPLSYFTFAESFGDADLLILDTAQLKDEGKDCRVIDGDSGEPLTYWEAAAPGFGKWLDRLVVAQGAKYWRWYR